MTPSPPCRLYSDVISTISGYGDLLWVDVVTQIDAMNERVLTFQASSKRLPKGLREWPAYLECKRTIDDFLLVLPLYQQLTHKALRPRLLLHPPPQIENV
jgi:dynein heavy chain